MVNYLKRLSQQYDRKIRDKCEAFRQQYLNCLHENRQDTYVCEPFFIQFHNCTEDFDKEFRKNYLLNRHLHHSRQ